MEEEVPNKRMSLFIEEIDPDHGKVVHRGRLHEEFGHNTESMDLLQKLFSGVRRALGLKRQD